MVPCVVALLKNISPIKIFLKIFITIKLYNRKLKNTKFYPAFLENLYKRYAPIVISSQVIGKKPNMKQVKKTNIDKTKKTASKIGYVLDTNVLIHDPYSIYSFDKAHIFLPILVLEELDNLKKEGSDRGRSTRQIIRELDNLRAKGNLSEGITLYNGSILQVVVATEKEIATFEKKISSIESIDNIIIFYGLLIQDRGYTVHFVSKDLNARIKANVFGIQAEDYTKESVKENEMFHGYHSIQVPSIELKKENSKFLESLENKLLINEFALMQSQHNEHNYSIARYLGPKAGFHFLDKEPTHWPIKPKNFQQAMALDLLLDPSIQLVSLIGPAGTGKTFLALLAGLYSVMVKKQYEKLLVSRPVIPLGRDIGYLPGTVEEKLHSWMLPIYDNLDLILHTISSGQHQHNPMHEQKHDYRKEHDDYKKGKKRKRHQNHNTQQTESHKKSIASTQELIRTGKLGLEAITYMRGRSIPYQYILIDEAQNLSRHEIKTLITRAGEGSKIVLTGDPYQFVSPYLDFSSNGVVICAERFKGNPFFGTVFLDISERSELSKIASELL